jgi:hydroxyethylthiazole kinase-like uncharacterized protein yjeF
MKILSAAQIREADTWTIQHEPISSIDLMERAATAFVDSLPGFHLQPEKACFEVYCGPGNNGGDGLAISRLLAKQGLSVKVFLLPSEKYSTCYLENLKRLKDEELKNVEITNTLVNLQSVEKSRESGPRILIDALFGTGLNKPLEGVASEWVLYLNRQQNMVIAVDIPSGLPCDNPPEKGAAVVQAAHTLTFQQPKLSFLFSDQAPFVGHFHLLDIGLDSGFTDSLPSSYTYVDQTFGANLITPRAVFSHKGNYGHALVVAGSYGKMGAAVLAVKACLRSGVGLVSAHIPSCGYTILQTAAPEAMVYPDEEAFHISSAVHLDPFQAVGVGPGIGMDKQTGNILKLLIQQSAHPMVIDADALNILGENKTWLSFLPKGSILTPHPREFERISGLKGNSFDRFEWQKEFSRKYGVIVVLKGAYTSVSCPDGQVFFNSSGNPGMAKGGSGDVLTGLITGLLAQGFVPQEAAVFGVYLHGLAGDIAARHLSMDAMTSGDIVSALGEAILQLHSAAT